MNNLTVDTVVDPSENYSNMKKEDLKSQHNPKSNYQARTIATYHMLLWSCFVVAKKIIDFAWKMETAVPEILFCCCGIKALNAELECCKAHIPKCYVICLRFDRLECCYTAI